MTADRRALRLALAVAVLAAIGFLPALRGPWIFDDHQLIEGNAEMHALSHAGAWLGHEFWHGAGLGSSLHYWRPLVSASYAVDWTIGGGQPVVFHVTNLVAHALAAVLVFLTLRRWTAQPTAAFAAAVLWAVHPTKAENVAWISGRTDILCTACVLVAAVGIARRLRGARASGLVLELAGTAGAYMAKELAVVLPVVAAVEAWVAAGRPPVDRTIGHTLVRPIARAVAPQLLVAVAYLVARAVWLPIGGAAGAHGSVDRVVTVVETYGRFVALVVAPHGLSMQHGLVRLHGGASHSAPYVIVGAAAAVATVAALVLLRKRSPVIAAGLAVFVVALVPALNLLQSNQQTLVAERFLYLPTLGLALAIAPALVHRRAQLLAGGVAVALIMLSLSRAVDFGDEDAFWAHELELHPDSPAALDYAIRAPMTAFVVDQIARADNRGADRATLAADLLDISVRSTSDRDPAALRALDVSAAALLAHRPARLGAHGVGVEIAIPDELAPPVVARIYAARAELAGRGGDPVAARAAAEAQRRACGDCDAAHATLALAEARAAAFGSPAEADGRYAHALELAGSHADVAASITAARRAAQARDQVAELSALGLWGAAYRAAQPRFAELTARRDDALQLAKLAFHAGHTVDAVDALASAVPAEQMLDTLASWARENGWIAPTSAGGPSSP